MKFFNTAGPIKEEIHYCISPIDRINKDEILSLIEQEKYFILPILLGETIPSAIKEEDILYTRDIGLIKKKGNWEISNAIYREIIPREITFATQTMMVQDILWYVENNKLQMSKLLEKFQEFFRENSESWLERFEYKEAGPHLLLMAFLQRVLNSGGRITREYGLGRKRIDLLVEYNNEKYAIELKINYGKKTKTDGIKQLKEYMDKMNASEGHLVIFNPDEKIWEKKIYKETIDNKITIWGM